MGALDRRLARECRWDVVEVPECGAEGLIVRRQVPVMVARLHSPARRIMPFDDVPRADAVVCGAIERRAVRGATAFSSPSSFMAREARALLDIGEPIDVVPNGIDPDLFDRPSSFHLRRALRIPAKRRVVLFSGRLERRKGIRTAFDVAAGILARHDAAFVFVGDDPHGVADDMLSRIAREKRLGSVHHLGRLDAATVRACMSQSDIVLIPSLWENAPYVCLEAMAAGRAIVASDQGGIPEMLVDGTAGLLAPPGDVAAFSRNVERLLADDAMRDRLGDAAARDARARFHDEDVARRTILLYERACSASSTAGAIDRAYADGPAARPSVIRRTRSGEGVGAP
jgi:glycosyltransferase involved in cell wall biosynthesis